MERASLISREQAFKQLKAQLHGRDLSDLAERYGITIKKGERTNKGWVGQTLERAAGLPLSSAAQRDGTDFELKSTSLVYRNEKWFPKETIKVTQLNPAKILEERFENSLLWQKISRLILVGVYKRNEKNVEVVTVKKVDVGDPDLVEKIRSFWEDVNHLLYSGDYRMLENLGTSDDFIQLRPVGDGKQISRCLVTGDPFSSRAFYVTKRFISAVLDLDEICAGLS